MTAPDGPSTKRRGVRMLVRSLLAVLVSLVALVWAFHDVDIDVMLANLRESSLTAVFVFFAGQLVIHGFRVLRWGMYIRPLGPQVQKRAIFAAANIGIGATFFLPLRLGEFVRPMMIHRAGVPFGSAVASVVVERIADGLCSVGMFFIFFSFVPETSPIPDELTRLSTGAAVLFGGALFFLIAAAVAREPVLGATQFILSRVSASLAERVVGLVATFLEGLAALGSIRRTSLFLLLTGAYWFGNGALTWVLAVSYQPELPVVSGLFTISVLVFAVMIPAGPAFAGTFEAGFRLGFGAFGLDPSSAVVIAVVAHVVQIVLMAGCIGLGMWTASPKQRAAGRSAGTSEGGSP